MKAKALSLGALLAVLLTACGGNSGDYIKFTDPQVERICVDNWDTDRDGHLSRDEAAAVTDLGTAFKAHGELRSFDELRHFKGLKRIPPYAFAFCEGLTSVIVPDGVTAIDSLAFYQCEGLTSISLPPTVEELGALSFSRCRSLRTIALPDGLKRLGESVFVQCSSLNGVELPTGIRKLPYRAFFHCNSLTKIRFNEGLEAIGAAAFSWGPIGAERAVVLPSTLKEIGDEAFMGCACMTTLKLEATVPPALSGTAMRAMKLGEIQVPAQALNAYRASADWKRVFEQYADAKFIGF